MADPARIILAGLVVGLLGATAIGVGSLQAASAADALEKATHTVGDLFADPPFDPRKLRKYDIALAESVSTEVQHSTTITKYGYGQKKLVQIVTTPSGTYSSDALTSPYVRYPGIDVTPRWGRSGHWYFSTSTSTYGTSTWSSMSSGSFTFYNYSFKPAARART